MQLPFTGFSPQATGFFAGLERNNTREWFEQNRAVFDAEVKAPMPP